MERCTKVGHAKPLIVRLCVAPLLGTKNKSQHSQQPVSTRIQSDSLKFHAKRVPSEPQMWVGMHVGNLPALLARLRPRDSMNLRGRKTAIRLAHNQERRVRLSSPQHERDQV